MSRKGKGGFTREYRETSVRGGGVDGRWRLVYRQDIKTEKVSQYIYLRMLYTQKLRDKKVNCITKTLSKYNVQRK